MFRIAHGVVYGKTFQFPRKSLARFIFYIFWAALLVGTAQAQRALTWQEIRDKFEAVNPSLQAGQIGVDESRASEITAFLRRASSFTVAEFSKNPNELCGGPPSASISGNCGATVRKTPRKSPSQVRPTSKEISFSTCDLLSSKRSREKRSWNSRGRTLCITTTSST